MKGRTRVILIDVFAASFPLGPSVFTEPSCVVGFIIDRPTKVKYFKQTQLLSRLIFLNKKIQ